MVKALNPIQDLQRQGRFRQPKCLVVLLDRLLALDRHDLSRGLWHVDTSHCLSLHWPPLLLPRQPSYEFRLSLFLGNNTDQISRMQLISVRWIAAMNPNNNVGNFLLCRLTICWVTVWSAWLLLVLTESRSPPSCPVVVPSLVLADMRKCPWHVSMSPILSFAGDR